MLPLWDFTPTPHPNTHTHTPPAPDITPAPSKGSSFQDKAALGSTAQGRPWDSAAWPCAHRVTRPGSLSQAIYVH